MQNNKASLLKPDVLQECLQFALHVFGINRSVSSMLQNSPRESGPIQPRDILSLCETLDIQADIVTKPLKKLQKLNVPCIILLKDKQAELFLPARTHDNKSYRPKDGLIEKDTKALKKTYIGRAIILSPLSGQTANKSASDNKHIDWIWRPLKECWDSYAEVMLASLFINLFALALPLFTMNVYDRVVPNFAIETLTVLTIGILLALGLDMLFKTIRTHILESLSARIGTAFDGEIMERLLNIHSINMTYSIGEQANLFKEIQSVRDFYAARLAPAFVDFPFFLLFLLVIVQISAPLVIVPIVAAILIIVLNILVHIPIKRLSTKYFEDIQNKSALLVETLAGAETLKMFNAIGHGLFRWNVSAQQSAQSGRKTNVMMSWAQNASVTTMHMVNVFVVVLGVHQINEGALTVGGLIACTILSARSIAPILALGGTISSMKRARDVVQTIDKIYALPHEKQNIQTKTESGVLKGNITFRDVSYAYPGEPLGTLHDLSLQISAGERVAIIGKTGAGKSTIARLLTGLVQPDKGNILIDDYALSALHPSNLRRSMGIVPQKSFFFKGSLRNNVLLGDYNIHEDAFNRAATIAGLHHYIQQSGNSFDTDIGENGNKLSGGQQQSIALARALIHNPDILILDEPTNGMDYALEGTIKKTLTDYLKNKTLILITHRTSLLSLVDRIILIDQGKIVADGPRDDIMKKLGGTV